MTAYETFGAIGFTQIPTLDATMTQISSYYR